MRGPSRQFKAPQLRDIDSIELDPLNPRLPEELTGAKQPALLQYLFENGVLEELAQSFIDNGYFSHEPIVVVRSDKPGRFVALEGNRRLATLKILCGSEIAEGIGFAGLEATSGQISELKEVPCYEVDSRESVYSFIGFRHIGGLKMWGPEAKARYVRQQVDEAAAAAIDRPFREIARRVGSSTQAIRNSYISFAILAHARAHLGLMVNRVLNGNRFGVWSRLLNSPDLREYIGFGDCVEYAEVLEGLKGLDKNRLSEVLLDLAPKDGAPPILRDSRLATDYARVITDPRAREKLRSTRNLSLARQVVDTRDLPARIRAVNAQAGLLNEEMQRLDVCTQELRDSVTDLYGTTRSMKALVKELPDT